MEKIVSNKKIIKECFKLSLKNWKMQKSQIVDQNDEIYYLLKIFWSNVEFIEKVSKGKFQYMYIHAARAILEIYSKIMFLIQCDEESRYQIRAHEAVKDLKNWKLFAESTNNTEFSNNLESHILKYELKDRFKNLFRKKYDKHKERVKKSNLDKSYEHAYSLWSQRSHGSFVHMSFVKPNDCKLFWMDMILIGGILIEILKTTNEFYNLDNSETKSMINKLNLD